MVSSVKVQNGVDKSIVYEMRRSGCSMREIAEKIGRSKERVRQILVKGLGTTDHEFLSTLQLCTLSGLPRNRVVELYNEGIISPATKWDYGNRSYSLWSFETMEKIRVYYQTHRLCKVCNKPLPKNRMLFCSDKCRYERHKYKNMTPEEKKTVLNNIRRYRERHKTSMEKMLAIV